MVTKAEEELYGQLDFYLALVCALVMACFLVSYKAMPRALPGEPKASPLEFFLGTSCLKYVRRPGEPPTTVDDFPDTGAASEEFDIELFAAKMSETWSPKEETPLFRKVMLRVLPWWVYTMAMHGAIRTLDFIAISYVGLVNITFMTSESMPDFAPTIIKFIAIGFVIAVGKEGIKKWAQLILALRGTDPIYAGLSLLIVQKLQRLSGTGMLQTNSAESQQVAQECFWIAVNLWASPVSTAPIDAVLGMVSLRKLYHALGFAGMAVCSSSIFSFQAFAWFCDRKNMDLDRSSFEATLRRQQALNMMLDNFRELRLYDWVRRAAKPMDGVRAQIRANRLWSIFYHALNAVVNSQIDGVVTVATCYITVFVRKGRVDFTEAQTARAYLHTLMPIIWSLAACRASWMDMGWKAGRIEKFLRLPEVDAAKCLEGPLEVRGGSYAYPVLQPQQADGGGQGAAAPAAPAPVLAGIDLRIGDGELVLVCGAIGAGKSSLLQALLGELPTLAGERRAPDAPIAYQPQVPYLIEGTIRENVLFGIRSEDCDEAHLQRALAAAQLAVDIQDPGSTLHIKGEDTNVGKRGTHLSGGQRARTALARTVYAVLQGAKVALLDDPVASVDNEVLQAAWEASVLGEMAGATRVVVVNSQLLERLAATADRLVVLSEGGIAYNGPPAEAFADQGILGKVFSGTYAMGASRQAYTWLPAGIAAVCNFAALFGNPREGDPFTQRHLELVQKSSPTPLTFEGLAEQKYIKPADRREARAVALPPKQKTAIGVDDELASGEDSALLLADTLREAEPLREFLRRPVPSPEEGERQAPLKLSAGEWEDLRLKLRGIERQYRRKGPQGSPKMSTVRLVFHLLHVAAGIFAICALLRVGHSFEHAIVLKTILRWSKRGDDESDWAYLSTLIGVFLCFGVLRVFLNKLEDYGALRLRLHLMERVDESLIALGMPFFWRKKNLAEPHLRRVVNQEAGAFQDIVKLPCMCLECLILISLTSIEAPSLWLLMPISFFGYYWTAFIPDWRNLQLGPAREELQNVAWAKVVEMWDILPTMRGLRREKEFQRTTYRGIMVIGWTNVMYFQVEVLMAFCHHSIGAVFNSVGLIMIIRMRAAGASAATALAFSTLALSANFRLFQMVNMYMPFRQLLQQYGQMEDLFCSDALETDDGVDPPPGFLSEGRIDFERVTFRYVAYLPPALQDISLVVQPGENLGVVGKTGSGKSTLVSLLLRLGPLRGVAPNSGGRVLLDGMDISTLRLRDLRQRIAVVPQEPTLFPMTLKENVGEEFSDAEVLTALQWCGLDARQIAGKEDGPVAEALAAPLRPGALSVGQQQLLMAARALVRRPRVLILDECTASLDRESADRLLDVLGSRSRGTTVLAIAHRLRFVLKSDRILVLSMGKVVACDTPAKLLEQPDSYFAVNLRYEQQQQDQS